MSKNCKIEFYFKRKDMEELLARNPDAKGVIVCQEIKPRKKADSKGWENITTITAYAKGSSAKSSLETDAEPVDPVYGCPNPPGCEEDTI